MAHKKNTSLTTRKHICAPTTKEPKINRALVASSAFNLKLCCTVMYISVQ